MASTEVVKAPPGGVTVKQGFAERELMLQTERAAVAQAAKAKAEVEARYVMALQRPRDWDDVRVSLKRECERPEFAKAARYKVPNRGEGFTIRFAEAAAAHMSNVMISSPCVVETDAERVINVTVMDLERNITWSKDVTVQKTVERKNPEGREVVRYRQKADGGTIAVVRATDEELLAKESALVSKAARTGILRIVPPDLLSECLAKISETLKSKDAEDPDAERKRLADAFAELNILPSHLKEFLGCELAQVRPAEFQSLRELYMALKEGHVTWREVMAAKKSEQSGESSEPKGTAALLGKLKPTAKQPGVEPEAKN